MSECLFADQNLSGWCVDSGVTRHIAKSIEGSINIKEVRVGNQKVYMGNNTYSDIMGIRSYRLNVGENNVLLTEVLFVSSMIRNLLYISILIEK